MQPGYDLGSILAGGFVMVRFTFHQLLCCAMIALMPASLMAAETGGGMVYVSGSTSVNGIAVTRSSAVFSGDTIATSSSSQAKINAAGASVTVFENSSVKFESGGVSVEDGSVNIGTYTKDLNARAGAVAVTPASSAWTEFEMSHRNGAVQIIARKGDVNISEGSETVTLLQGQSATRDDSATSHYSVPPHPSRLWSIPPRLRTETNSFSFLLRCGIKRT